MSGKVFLDSNILVYAQDAGSADKQRRSRDLITRLAATGDGVISTHVMQEFFVSVTRKLGVPPLAAKAILKTLTVFEIVTAGPELMIFPIEPENVQKAIPTARPTGSAWMPTTP